MRSPSRHGERLKQLAVTLDRTLQCVAFDGVLLAVLASHLRFTAADSGFLPGGLRFVTRPPVETIRDTALPPEPHAGIEFPVRFIIAFVPRPSAVASTISAASGSLLAAGTDPQHAGTRKTFYGI